MKYAVIIDAGSSGSRAFVYSWPDVLSYKSNLGPDSVLNNALLPIETSKDWVNRIQPGISSFQGDTRSIWKKHLKPLLKNALKIVPKDQISETPIYFLATAGLRLLPKEDQTQILSQVCRYLQRKTNFLVPECSSHVTMIDGETEGLYGWLGLNYLVHYSIAKKWDSFEDTYGFLDMGGASAQLAFLADRETHKDLAASIHDIRVRTAAGNPVDWNVYVTTWLGHGANQAHNRLRKQIIGALTPEELKSSESDSVVAVDPCLPVGATDITTIDEQEYTFYGSGDFASCEALTTALLNENSHCTEGHACLFESVSSNDFSLEGQKFVGVSEYWYTLQDLFSTNGKFDYAHLEPKVRVLCSGDWANIQSSLERGELLKGGDTPFNEHEIKQACFKSAWVLTVLRKGLNFALNTENPSLHHNFQDTFQSAIDIDGTEISWTLGRAVLYASSQIPPSSGTEHLDVGYSDSNSQFINGGEMFNSKELKIMTLTKSYTHAGYMSAYFMLFTLIMILIFCLKVRHTKAAISVGNKIKRWCQIFYRKFRTYTEQRKHRNTADSIGYGYSYPHAGIPLNNTIVNDSLEELAQSRARSTSRPPTRTPSRVGSRINIKSTVVEP